MSQQLPGPPVLPETLSRKPRNQDDLEKLVADLVIYVKALAIYLETLRQQVGIKLP